MLTIFCSPKPFQDEADFNQRNALRSWRAIGADVQIIVFGDPPGAAAAAAEVGAEVVREFECSASGAPSFNAMADYVRQNGRHDLQVYVNADILLNSSMVAAMQLAHESFPRFLLVGERYDLGEGVKFDVLEADWVKRLGSLTNEGRAEPHGPTGADFFGFSSGMWSDLPPVFMGRAMCDQALLHFCLKRRIPVLDATLSLVAVHQFHGYRHVAGGTKEVFGGAEFRAMSVAHGLKRSLPTVADADWQLAGTELVRPDRRRLRLLRRAELWTRYRMCCEPLALGLRAMQYLAGGGKVGPRKFEAGEMFRAWGRATGVPA